MRSWLLLAGITAWLAPEAGAQEVPIAEPADGDVIAPTGALDGEKEAVIRFLGPSTLTYRGVLVHMDWWLAVPEQWELTSPATIEIAFSHSPVLIERLSSMTASVNDIGVSSTFLNLQNAKDARVVWTIDPSYLRPGDMNKVSITAKMRSDLELCDDVHSPALWLSLHAGTSLRIRYKDRPVALDVSKFPDTYLRPEVFHDDDPKVDATHAIIVVQKPPTPAALRGIGIVAARLGRTRFPKGRIEVVSVDAITPEVQDRLSKHHLIAIGTTPLMDMMVAAGLDIRDVYAPEVGAGMGHLIEGLNPWNGGRRALLVTGADDEALGKVVTALSLPHLSTQWRSPEGDAPQRAVSFAAAPAIPAEAKDAAHGTYTISLADLGSTDMTVRGKFHHHMEASFPNPFVGRVKSPAFVRLFLSHSELLVPQTSSLLVKVNDEPIRSIRLSPRTSQRLEADVVIPEKFLSQRTITVKLEAFLDIGEPDCHYNFPEMAWVTLFNTSYIAFPLSDAPTTSLRSYPWVVAKEPHLGGVTFVVANDPSAEALTAVANTVAYLSKSLPRFASSAETPIPVEQWIHPWVKQVDALSADDLERRDVVLVGDYALVQTNPKIVEVVPQTLFAEAAAPDNLPGYSAAPFRSEAGWIHLAQSPFAARRNLLIVSGAKGPRAAAEAAEYLWDPRKVERLGGSTVMVGPNGALQVLIPAPGEQPQAAPSGPLTPKVPEELQPEPPRPKAKTAVGATALDDGPSEVPAAPTSRHQIAYLVFAILGLLLVVLVVVRIRDSMRSAS